jgi:hypothetical protein
MDASKMMVLIFSNHANESPQVRREVERAISKGLIVLPFRVEDVKPAGAMEFALSNTHWLDGFTPPLERRFGKLAKSVKDLLANDPGEAAEPPAPPVNPRPSAVSAPPRADSQTGDRRPCPICEKLHGTGAAILVFYLCFVPIVCCIAWFVLSYQAAAVLREKGFTVGFMGAHLSEFSGDTPGYGPLPPRCG